MDLRKLTRIPDNIFLWDASPIKHAVRQMEKGEKNGLCNIDAMACCLDRVRYLWIQEEMVRSDIYWRWFFSACAALAVSFTVYDTLMDGDSDSTKQHKIPKSQAPSPSPSSSQSAPKQQQPHVAATTKKKCDTSKLTVGGCVMQKYDMYDGTTRFRDISNLMKNGNYSLSTRWEGEECYADVHVSGIANGNSYNTSFSCKVWQ